MANIAVSESLFLKNVLVSEGNFLILYTGIGYMSFFVLHHNATHFFCDIRKKSHAFFMPIFSHHSLLPKLKLQIYCIALLSAEYYGDIKR